MMSWPRATMRTSSSDSRVRRCSSLRPRRAPRSTSGASDDPARDRGGRFAQRSIVPWSTESYASRAAALSAGARRSGGTDADVQLAQPLGRHRATAPASADPGACWFIGNAMTSRMFGLAGQQHDDAVDAGRRAAVRRRAVPERVQHAAEALLHLLAAVAGDARTPCT